MFPHLLAYFHRGAVWLSGVLICLMGCAAGSEIEDEEAMMSPGVSPQISPYADAYMRPASAAAARLDGSVGLGVGPATTAAGEQPRPVSEMVPSDASVEGPDRFIPPAAMARDMGAVSAPETLSECIEGMINRVKQVYAADDCEQYSDQDKENPSSTYFQTRGTAACIKVECNGLIVDEHNGIVARRTCRDLDDLVKVLDKGRDDAINSACMAPKLQIRFVPKAEFRGMEPCDQYVCGLDREGNPIIGVDN
ncbi:MAG: hypothetical protein VX589_06210 [Myxococcota bacterium]|nr:hypothetical protein [Myxococcota bacterium]